MNQERTLVEKGKVKPIDFAWLYQVFMNLQSNLSYDWSNLNGAVCYNVTIRMIVFCFPALLLRNVDLVSDLDTNFDL